MNIMKKGHVLNKAKSLSSCLIFILTFITGLIIYGFIQLPFVNPWGVTGPLTAIQYNPANNIIRFLLIIILPSLFLVALNFNKSIKGFLVLKANGAEDFLKPADPAPNKSITVLKICLYFLVFTSIFLIAGNLFTYEGIYPLDTFHAGETLGAAVDYLNGKIPYRDTLYIHGVFEDPLRSVIAFKLFGHSIASVRMFESILQVFTLLLFSMAIYYIFDKNIFYASVSFFILQIFLLFKPAGTGFALMSRDIPFYIFLIVAAALKKIIENNDFREGKLKTCFYLFLFSFIPILSFAYSIEIGFYLSAASLIYSFAIYLFFLRKDIFKFIASSLSGYILGIIALGITLKWAYYDFFKFTFIIMPQYKELMDGYVYRFKQFEYLFPVLLISLLFYWLTFRFITFAAPDKNSLLNKIKSFYSAYFLEILLLISSVFFFRGALGRADIGHVYSASAPVFILFAYILTKYSLSLYFYKNGLKNFVMSFIVSFMLIAVIMSFYIPKMNYKGFYRFSPEVSDTAFIPQNYIKTIIFLRENLGNGEEFLTMTSEAIWYYFINKPCPTRFPVVWFAMPYFYQNEIVEDLKRRNVKFVLYKNNNWSNAIDGFTNEIRLPIVIAYLKKHYVFYRKMDDNEIWIRKREAIL